MKNLIFNSSNVVPGSNSARFRYNFLNGNGYDIRAGDQMCLGNITLPYSWFNITALNGNNTYKFSFNATQYTVTMPDGFYTIEEINQYLQFYFVSQGLYTKDSSGNNVYYARWIENTTRYAIEWDSFPISLASGGSNPTAITLSGNIPLLQMQAFNFLKCI